MDLLITVVSYSLKSTPVKEFPFYYYFFNFFGQKERKVSMHSERCEFVQNYNHFNKYIFFKLRTRNTPTVRGWLGAYRTRFVIVHDTCLLSFKLGFKTGIDTFHTFSKI